MGRFAAKAAQGKFANKVVTTYKAYLDNPEIAKQENPVTNRPASQPLYIEPFSFDMPADYYVKVSASTPVVTARLAAINTGGVRTLATLATGDIGLRVARFRPAKIIITTGRRATGTREVSKTSGLPYKAYGGNRSSIPFGRATAAEEIAVAFNTIRNAILGTPADPNLRVTLYPERYSP